MKIPLKFVELHTPLFLGGKNLKTKLSTKYDPVTLTYDREEKELHVVHNGNAAILPWSSVSSMDPVDPTKAGVDMNAGAPTPAANPAPRPAGRIKAQVSAPPGIKID